MGVKYENLKRHPEIYLIEVLHFMGLSQRVTKDVC